MSGPGTPAAIPEHLEVLPAYKRQEKERWSSAMQLFAEMLSRGGSPEQSPQQGIVHHSHSDTRPICVANRDQDRTQIGSYQPAVNLHQSISDHLLQAPENIARSWSGMVTPSRLGGLVMTGPGDAKLRPTSLELEAIAAVHELSFAVEQIVVSDVLPRTAELIFVNVTTVESKTFCLELTMKGWRVCSVRHDCMNGDYLQWRLHSHYYDTVYALMDTISRGYRQRFSEKLAARLRLLQANEASGDLGGHAGAAPPSSYAQLPMFPPDLEDEQGELQESESGSGSLHDENTPVMDGLCLQMDNIMDVMGGMQHEQDNLNLRTDDNRMGPVVVNVRHPSGSNRAQFDQ